MLRTPQRVVCALSLVLSLLLAPIAPADADGGQGDEGSVQVKNPKSGTYVGRWNGERYKRHQSTARQPSKTKVFGRKAPPKQQKLTTRQLAALEAMCREWQLLAQAEGDAGKVYFAGWRSQPECAAILARSSALVLSSLRECGGAVVLEAMASSRPVIATDWGGPADYLDPACGVLVRPDSRVSFIGGLADALVTLAQSRELRVTMGRAGRIKATRLFDWDLKAQRMVQIYREAIWDAGRKV